MSEKIKKFISVDKNELLAWNNIMKAVSKIDDLVIRGIFENDHLANELFVSLRKANKNLTINWLEKCIDWNNSNT